MDIGEVFKAKAKKYNNYQETDRTKKRNCFNCIRWRLSYPYNCNDCQVSTNRAETCLNYTTDKNCPVD